MPQDLVAAVVLVLYASAKEDIDAVWATRHQNGAVDGLALGVQSRPQLLGRHPLVFVAGDAHCVSGLLAQHLPQFSPVLESAAHQARILEACLDDQWARQRGRALAGAPDTIQGSGRELLLAAVGEKRGHRHLPVLVPLLAEGAHRGHVVVAQVGPGGVHLAARDRLQGLGHAFMRRQKLHRLQGAHL